VKRSDFFYNAKRGENTQRLVELSCTTFEGFF
jgi:hypothetical protein